MGPAIRRPAAAMDVHPQKWPGPVESPQSNLNVGQNGRPRGQQMLV